jgi:tetratricopeptide (TPR) repeat protein
LIELNAAEAAGLKRWEVRYYRGRALAALGRYEEALTELNESAIKRGLPLSDEVAEVGRIIANQGHPWRGLWHDLRYLPWVAGEYPKFAFQNFGVGLFVAILDALERLSRFGWKLSRGWPKLARIHRRFLPPDRIELERGVGYAAQGLWHAALRHFRNAYNIDPTRAWTSSYLAGALVHIGREEEAREFAERSMKLDPQDSIVRHNYEQILKSSS